MATLRLVRVCCVRCSYNNPHPMAEDYAKEPPVMPPHLQLTLLNVPSTAESTTSLPRPQHVILNHIYVQRGQVGARLGWLMVPVRTCCVAWAVAVPMGSKLVCSGAASRPGAANELGLVGSVHGA